MAVRPLRVAVDATSCLGVQTGVGRFTVGLLEHLSARADLDLIAYAVTWRGRTGLQDLLPEHTHAATRRFPARLTRVLWPRVARPRVEGWTGPVDIVHATNYVAPPSRVPVLLTIHDLGFVRFPAFLVHDARRYPRLVQVAIDRGATVHTDSEFVAAEVRDAFGLPTERVISLYPGLAAPPAGDAVRGRRVADAQRYVLALGTVEPRKNFPALVRAFDAVAGVDREVRLIVAGADGHDLERFSQAVAAAHHKDRIRRLGWVDEASRADLLAGAAVLAYPSVYEGFGFPPLEAMQVGVPVVASQAGALPEVLGDAASLPDPHDIDAIAAALTAVLGDQALREALVRRGYARAARYAWDHVIGGYLAAYRRVAEC